MNFNSSTLAEARKQGLTDDDIQTHLSSIDPRFQQAKESGLSLDDVAQHFDEQAGSESSALGTAAREGVKSLAPGAAALAAGEGAAALLAPTAVLTGGIPVIPAIGGALAGAGTFMVARNAQNKALNAVAPNSTFSGDEERGLLGLGAVEKEATGQAKADEAHPWAKLAGGLVGGGGPISVSAGARNLETLATKEGWSGIKTAAKNLGNEEFMEAAKDAASPEAKQLQQLHTATHAAVGSGVNAGIGLAQGQSPGEALGTAAVGLVQKPWFGKHGVFGGKNPVETGSGKNPPPTDDTKDEGTPVPLTPEEQAAANEAATKVDQVTGSAIQSNLEAGNEQTAKALSEVSATPISSTPVDDTATQEEQDKSPEVTDAAQKEADRLGVDTSKIPANKQGKVTKIEVQRWAKSQPKGQNPTAETVAQPEVVTPNTNETQEPATPSVAAEPPANGESVAPVQNAGEAVDQTGVLPDLQNGAEPVAEEPELNEEEIPEHAFEGTLPEQPGNIVLPSLDQVPQGQPLPEQPGVVVDNAGKPAAKNIRPSYPKGATARTFVSPNTAEGRNVDQAIAGLGGKEHSDLAAVADRALETLPVDRARGQDQNSTRSDAVGTWLDNSGENSLLIRHNGEVDPDALRATAATLAAHGEQKQALIFQKSDGGKDQMYEFTLPGVDIKQASAALENWAKESGYENGFGSRTLEKDGDGTRVTIVNPESDKAFTETYQKVRDFTNQHGLKRNIYPGTSESLGDPNGTDRDLARQKYSEAIKRYVSGRTGGGDAEGHRGNEGQRINLDQRHRHRLWELAQEIGLDVGDRPEGLPQEAGKQSPDEGTLASTEVDSEEIKKAESGIPEERREEYGQLLAQAQKSLQLAARSGGYSGYSQPLMELAVNRAWDQLRVRMGKFLTEHPEAKLSQSEFNKIASGNLSNAVEVIGNRLNNEMAYGDVNQARKAPESVDLDTQNDSAENGVGNVGQGTEGSGAFSPAEKETVFQKIQDPATPVADKIALGRHLYDSGSLQKTEIERLTKLLPEQKAISADDFQESQDIFNTYDADQIMRGEHRDADGNLIEDGAALRKPAAKPPGEEEVEKNLLREMGGWELVKRVANHPNSNPLQRKIAQILLGNKALDKIVVQVYDRLNPGSEAEYHPDAHAILISREQTEGEINPQTSLHEIFHALTKAFFHPANRSILTEPQKTAVQGIRDLFRQARSQAEKLGLTSKEKYQVFSKEPDRAFEEHELEHYGWSDADEFISEAMTNERFQDQLRQIDVRNSVSGKKTTAWDLFKNTVRMLLGLPRPDNSALSKAVDHILELSMSDTPIGFGENGEVLRGRAYKEGGVLRALAVKPTEVLGKTPSGVQGKIVPEEPSVSFAKNLTEAKEALKVIMTQPEQRVTKGRLGTPVNFGTADHKLRERLGQPLLDLQAAKIMHATGTSESKYQTPDAGKVRTAPLIFQTVRQADLAGDFQTEFTQRQNAAVDDSRFHKTDRFYIKLYNDPESPTGVRWHTVVTDHDGNFVTQFSSPELGGNAANRGTVTAAGQRAPKTKRSPHLLHNPADTVTESVDQKATISGDKGNIAPDAEGIKQKISGMSEEQVIQRAVELGAKQDAGHALTPEEVAEQQAINQDSRFGGSSEPETLKRPATKKSQSIYNDRENPYEYIPTTRPEVTEEIGRYFDRFKNAEGNPDLNAALSDLRKGGALISLEAKEPAASTLEEIFRRKVGELETRKANGEYVPSNEITAAQRSADQAKRLSQESRTLLGKAFRFLKDKELFTSSGAVDTYLKTILGGTVEDLTQGKIDADRLREGMASIRQQIADVTVDSAKRLLGVFGISDEESINKIKAELGDLNSDPKNLGKLVGTLLGGEAKPEKVRALTQQLHNLYNAAHARMAKSRVSSLVSDTYNGMLERDDMSALSSRLTTQLKPGRFNEEQFNGALLDSLGIQGYSPEKVAAIRDRVNEIQRLPEGSDQQNKLKTKFKSAMAMELLNHRWNNEKLFGSNWVAKARIALTEMGPDLFRSLILTGPQTFMTHGFSGALNTRLSGAALSWGYLRSSLKNGTSFSDSVGYFKDFLDTMILPGTSGARNGVYTREALSALHTGQMGLAAEQGVGHRGADAMANSDFGGNGLGGKIFRGYAGMASFGGRAMMAFDAVNANGARELALRLMSRAALIEGGVTGKKLGEQIRQIFAPTKEEMAQARAQLQDEVDRGYFAGLTKAEQMYSKAARLDQIFLQGALPHEVLGANEEKALEFSKETTLKGDLVGFPGMLAASIGDMGEKFPLIKYCFPFLRILSTALNNSLEYTPMGLLKANNATLSNALMGSQSKYAKFRYKTYEKGTPEQIALMAKSVLGTGAALMLTKWFLHQLDEEMHGGKKPQFMVYGQGPMDPAKRSEMMASGWRPGTVMIGNTYLPYKAIPGLDLIFTGLGALHDELVYNNPPPKMHGHHPIAQAGIDMKPDRMMKIALAVALSPLQHHFLDGAKNLVSVMYDSEGSGGEKAIRALQNLVINPASQFTNPSIARTARTLIDGLNNPNHDAPQLSQSSLHERMYQFSPFYFGYDKPSLNVLGDPIQKKATDALTDRWIYSANTAPDPILTPLVRNGLFLAGPKKSAPIIVNRKGEMLTLNDAGDDAWRSYVVARGQFLKRVLSPTLVDRLTQMDRIQAQSILDGPGIQAAANKYAAAIVERDILRGRIKVNS